MTPEQMSALHQRAFAPFMRGWSVSEFRALCGDPNVFAVGDAVSFALSRVVVDEAELLTLACAPEHRRKGHARACLNALTSEACARGAKRLFLDVAADNVAARTLYAGAGFEKVGRRPGYYARPAGEAVDALLLEKRFTSPASVDFTGL
ncbi:MAG: GNAT family N-acetyltransferase [Pseudomonadota bacterium]